MGSIAIHAESNIPWHSEAAQRFQNGLRAIGLKAHITPSRQRESNVAILLGTTCWRNIEADGRYLLVDRASYGDPLFVQLVWDGHGRRGDHKVPARRNGRWEATRGDIEIKPWRPIGHRILLCGQTEPYSPKYKTMTDWYRTIRATHFRKHPQGVNPTPLPMTMEWDNVGLAVTLNSSIGVESVFRGIPTVTMDEQAMAWDVTSHRTDERLTPERDEWLEWLAWTQWRWDEIEAGKPIKHLFEER